jgi:hypothetical protein
MFPSVDAILADLLDRDQIGGFAVELTELAHAGPAFAKATARQASRIFPCAGRWAKVLNHRRRILGWRNANFFYMHTFRRLMFWLMAGMWTPNTAPARHQPD